MRSHVDLGRTYDNDSCSCIYNSNRSRYSQKSMCSDYCFVPKKLYPSRYKNLRTCRFSMEGPQYFDDANGVGDCPAESNYCLMPLDPVNGFELIEYADKSSESEITEKDFACKSMGTSRCCCDRECETRSLTAKCCCDRECETRSLTSKCCCDKKCETKRQIPKYYCDRECETIDQITKRKNPNKSSSSLKVQFSKSTVCSGKKSSKRNKEKNSKKCRSTEKNVRKNSKKSIKEDNNKCTCKSSTIIYFKRNSKQRLEPNYYEQIEKIECNNLATCKKASFFERIKSIFKK